MTATGRDEVVFVGGTAFSGADVVAGLIATHGRVAAVSAPARFHSDSWGIPALLNGRIGLDDFVVQLRAHEVARRVRPEALDAAVAVFREGYHSDPLESSRALFWALVSELVEDDVAATLVEWSPGNLLEAQALARLVPEARFVHVVRDGRDVAAAVCESDSGPGRMVAALEWWADGLREIERGFRGEEDGAPYAVPEERIATVVLDELVSGDRDAAYRHLLQRLSLDDDGPMRAAQTQLDPAAIGRGGWRRHARGPAAWWLARRYARTLAELRQEGNHAVPPLASAFERLD